MIAIDQFERVAVLCVGDVMLDRFIDGSVHRVSPESPVPVLSIRENRLFPGGAANVARNIAALGARCTLVGVRGADRAGDELAAAVAAIDGVTPVMMVAGDRPTTEKMRFVAQGQQLLRVDQEDVAPLSPEFEERLLAHLAAHLEGHQVMVLSDYAKGVLTPAVVRGAIAMARACHMPVIVDPKSPHMGRYSGATVVTPNAREVHAATGLDPTEDDAVAELAGRRILADSGIESVLVTRAQKGMTLVSRTAPPSHLPAHAREVFDVAGAGDTVVATLAVAIGLGETLGDAAMLANVAAGIVVGKRGTATVSQRELVRELVRVSADHLAPLRGKILFLSDAIALADKWRRDGRSIGVISGCFDRVGPDQISQLSFARSRCDRLIVGLQSDGSTRLRPVIGAAVNREDDRALALAAMTAVHAVVLFDESTPAEILDRIAPHVALDEGQWDAGRVAR